MVSQSFVAWLEETLDSSPPGAFSVLDLQRYASRLAAVVANCQGQVVFGDLAAAQHHLQRAVDCFDDRMRRYNAIEASRASLERALSGRFLEK